MARTIRVKSALKQEPDGGFPIAIFERHDMHPGGELFIADDQTHEVVVTPGVTLALNDKRLVDVDDDDYDGGDGDGDESEEAGPDAQQLQKDNTRAELDVMATGLGFDPADYANMPALADAIVEAREASKS